MGGRGGGDEPAPGRRPRTRPRARAQRGLPFSMAVVALGDIQHAVDLQASLPIVAPKRAPFRWLSHFFPFRSSSHCTPCISSPLKGAQQPPEPERLPVCTHIRPRLGGGHCQRSGHSFTEDGSEWFSLSSAVMKHDESLLSRDVVYTGKTRAHSHIAAAEPRLQVVWARERGGQTGPRTSPRSSFHQKIPLHLQPKRRLLKVDVVPGGRGHAPVLHPASFAPSLPRVPRMPGRFLVPRLLSLASTSAKT